MWIDCLSSSRLLFPTLSDGSLHCAPAAPLSPCAPVLWSVCRWSRSGSGSHGPGRWCGCYGNTAPLAALRYEPGALVPGGNIWRASKWTKRSRMFTGSHANTKKTDRDTLFTTVTCLWLCSIAFSSSLLAAEFSLRWICFRCSMAVAWRWFSSARRDAAVHREQLRVKNEVMNVTSNGNFPIQHCTSKAKF